MDTHAPNSPESMIARVSVALGRNSPPSASPSPPEIDEPITRLVHAEIGLSELFSSRAAANGMHVQSVRVDQLHEAVITFLRRHECKVVAVAVSDSLEKLALPAALESAGFTVRSSGRITLDELYEVDAGLTDVDFAVAETGGLVVRAGPGHGRGLSLIPPVHVAIVEPARILPDLVDLFDRLREKGTGSAATIITGPSKTSDIEMTPVTGVHGPGVVGVFVLE